MSVIFDELSGMIESLLCGPSTDADSTILYLCYLCSGRVFRDPADAVLSSYGVSIGSPPASTLPTVPDMLLGFVDTEGIWHWPVRAGVAHNLHARPVYGMPCPESYPVWLTVGDMDVRRRLMRRKKHIDLFAYVLQHKRRLFWRASLKEFIETTWHPCRVEQWCFDEETKHLESTYAC